LLTVGNRGRVLKMIHHYCISMLKGISVPENCDPVFHQALFRVDRSSLHDLRFTFLDLFAQYENFVQCSILRSDTKTTSPWEWELPLLPIRQVCDILLEYLRGSGHSDFLRGCAIVLFAKCIRYRDFDTRWSTQALKIEVLSLFFPFLVAIFRMNHLQELVMNLKTEEQEIFLLSVNHLLQSTRSDTLVEWLRQEDQHVVARLLWFVGYSLQTFSSTHAGFSLRPASAESQHSGSGGSLGSSNQSSITASLGSKHALESMYQDVTHGPSRVQSSQNGTPNRAASRLRQASHRPSVRRSTNQLHLAEAQQNAAVEGRQIMRGHVIRGLCVVMLNCLLRLADAKRPCSLDQLPLMEATVELVEGSLARSLPESVAQLMCSSVLVVVQLYVDMFLLRDYLAAGNLVSEEQMETFPVARKFSYASFKRIFLVLFRLWLSPCPAWSLSAADVIWRIGKISMESSGCLALCAAPSYDALFQCLEESCLQHSERWRVQVKNNIIPRLQAACQTTSQTESELMLPFGLHRGFLVQFIDDQHISASSALKDWLETWEHVIRLKLEQGSPACCTGVEWQVDRFWSLSQALRDVPSLRLSILSSLLQTHQQRGKDGMPEASLCAVMLAAIRIEATFALKDCLFEIAESLNLERGVTRNALQDVHEDICWQASVLELEGEPIIHTLYWMVDHGSSSICSVDAVMKELKLAIKLSEEAELSENAALLSKIFLRLYEDTEDFTGLRNTHGYLSSLYRGVSDANVAKNRLFGIYYRVGFYGPLWGTMEGKEYVYRAPRLTRLLDMKSFLKNGYEEVFGSGSVVFITDSKAVDTTKLNESKVYIQLTTLEPYFPVDDPMDRVTHFERSTSVSFFEFVTPFTSSGKAQGTTVREQCARKTILRVPHPFPYVVTRQPVVQRYIMELNPLESSLEAIDRRTEVMTELARATNLSKNNLQSVLQGSVLVQVNAGPGEICEVFLGEANLWPAREVFLMQRSLTAFLSACKECLVANSTLIGKEQNEFQHELEKGYQRLVTFMEKHFADVANVLQGEKKRRVLEDLANVSNSFAIVIGEKEESVGLVTVESRLDALWDVPVVIMPEKTREQLISSTVSLADYVSPPVSIPMHHTRSAPGEIEGGSGVGDDTRSLTDSAGSEVMEVYSRTNAEVSLAGTASSSDVVLQEEVTQDDAPDAEARRERKQRLEARRRRRQSGSVGEEHESNNEG
jgi:hypothetical protein